MLGEELPKVHSHSAYGGLHTKSCTCQDLCAKMVIALIRPYQALSRSLKQRIFSGPLLQGCLPKLGLGLSLALCRTLCADPPHRPPYSCGIALLYTTRHKAHIDTQSSDPLTFIYEAPGLSFRFILWDMESIKGAQFRRKSDKKTKKYLWVSS